MPELFLPRGVITPVVTPFRNGEIDLPQFAALVARQASAGVNGIIVGDQMGEGLTLMAKERGGLLSAAIDTVGDRIPVIAAVGYNCTSTTIAAINALPDGISALLVTIPYYSKPTDKGIIHHFRLITEVTNLPIIIDDDPQRTAKPLTHDILEALRPIQTIRGVRHCGGDVAAFASMAPALRRHYRHYANDDRTALAYLMAGASALSSPIANVFPKLVRSFYDLAQTHDGLGDIAADRRIANALRALDTPDPASLKFALSVFSDCSEEVRLPLLPPDEGTKLAITEFMVRQFLCDGDSACDRIASV